MAFSSKGSKLINMDPNNDDPFYRYKFESILISNQGKNTGQVTIIMNIYNIASAIIGVEMNESKNNKAKYSSDIIHKTAEHITKYIRKKIASQGKYHKMQKQTRISGRHQIDTLQHYLFKYAQEYVQCPKCSLFELSAATQPNVRCKSCGYKLDQRKHQKKHQKRNKKKEKKKTEISEEKENDNSEDENKDDIQQKIAKDPIFAFSHWLNQNQNVSLSIDQILEKIKILSIAFKLDRKRQIQLIMVSLLNFEKDDHKLFIKSIKKYSSILETYTLLNDDTPILLSYLEQIICDNLNLLNHSYQILHCLYDEDIVCEDELIEWHQTINNDKHRIVSREKAHQIRDKAESFIKWLKETEEEEEDQDSD